MKNDKPIVEGLIAGGGALLISILWIVFGALHPLVILPLYLVALFCLSISIIWFLAEENSLRSWFIKQPTRFFIVGFIEVLLIVGFLDIYYLGKLGGVLVEAHGLVFDLFIFGIVLTAYEAIKSKQDRVQRYKEELDDYRGWKSEEAGYRVAGIINRLEAEAVNDINFNELNLSKCSRETVEKAVMTKAHVISLQGFYLEGANLEGANLEGTNLQGAKLEGTNLQGAKLARANLQGAKLARANLEGANLQGANLQGTDISLVKLQSALLGFANLEGANLQGANLERANLTGANLEGAYLTGANLEGAYLREVNLKGAMVFGIAWFERLKKWEIIGLEDIEAKYYVDDTPLQSIATKRSVYYVIKERQCLKNRDQ